MNKELKEKLKQFETFTNEILNEINTEEDLQEFWEESLSSLNSQLNRRAIDLEEL